MVRMIKTLDEFMAVLQESGGKLVVVDFTAQWCGPCRRIAPHFEEFSRDPANTNVVFLKVDVDEASEVAQHCGIRAMPTFIFYKNGQEVKQFSGADLGQLKSIIESLK